MTTPTGPDPADMPAIYVTVEDGAADTAEVAETSARLSRMFRRGLEHLPAPVAAGKVLTFVPEEIGGVVGSGKSPAFLDILTALSHGKTAVVMDPKRADGAWKAMAGYRDGDVTPDEDEAARRGVSPSVYRRLNPAVTGELADQLVVGVAYLAARIAAHLIDSIGPAALPMAGQLTRDPRSAGFRIGLFQARLAATAEPVRKAALLVEWALTAISQGREQSAIRKLDRADELMA